MKVVNVSVFILYLLVKENWGENHFLFEKYCYFSFNLICQWLYISKTFRQNFWNESKSNLK